jgi:hypothetical protein
MKRTWKVAAVAMVLAGCIATGGDGDDGDDNDGAGGNNGGQAWTVAQADARKTAFFAEYICKITFDCPEWGDAGLLTFTGRFRNKAACEAGAIDVLGIDLGNEAAAIEGGRLRFDGTKAQACFDEAEAALEAACSGQMPQELGDACELMYVGLIAEGGNCLESTECEGDQACIRPDNQCYGTCAPDEDPCRNCTSDQYCEGRQACAPRGSLGATCGDSDQCVQGVACVDGACAEPTANFLNAGEACGLALQDGGRICQPGSTCVDFVIEQGSATGVCGTPRGADSACFLSLECAPGLACGGGDPSTGMAGTCGPLGAMGDSCFFPFDCESGQCEGTCVERMACMVP